jgi:hypothetical protein
MLLAFATNTDRSLRSRYYDCPCKWRLMHLSRHSNRSATSWTLRSVF